MKPHFVLSEFFFCFWLISRYFESNSNLIGSLFPVFQGLSLFNYLKHTLLFCRHFRLWLISRHVENIDIFKARLIGFTAFLVRLLFYFTLLCKYRQFWSTPCLDYWSYFWLISQNLIMQFRSRLAWFVGINEIKINQYLQSCNNVVFW